MKTRQDLIKLGMRGDRKIESMSLHELKKSKKSSEKVYVLDRNPEGFAFVWVGQKRKGSL